MNTPLNTHRENMVKLYQVQCSNESLPLWMLFFILQCRRNYRGVCIFPIFLMYYNIFSWKQNHKTEKGK